MLLSDSIDLQKISAPGLFREVLDLPQKGIRELLARLRNLKNRRNKRKTMDTQKRNIFSEISDSEAFPKKKNYFSLIKDEKAFPKKVNHFSRLKDQNWTKYEKD